MRNKKAPLVIAYAGVLIQLGTYVANDTGRLSRGRLYWTLVYVSGIALLGAVIWLARLRSRPPNSREVR